MIIDENFKKLKAELSNAVVAFQKERDGYKLFFNNHLGFQAFKQNLNILYYEFINEVRNNSNNLKTDKERHIYLEMLLHVFEVLDDQVGVFPDFVSPHRHVKMISKTNIKLSCIHTCSEDLSQMLVYFQYQKQIIQKSIRFIGASMNRYTSSNGQNNKLVLSWKDELKDFYPEMIRLKDGVNQIALIPDKIRFLQEERRVLAIKLEKKGIDLYASAINFFFESRIECLKDWLIHESKLKKKTEIDFHKNGIEVFLMDLLNTLEIANSHLSKDEIKSGLVIGIQKVRSFFDGNFKTEKVDFDTPHLNWTESKTALVELIYALNSSASINKGKVGIKTITKFFENLFSIELGDVYHTFSEIRSRKIEQTKFIDLLKDSLLSKMKEIDEKSCR